MRNFDVIAEYFVIAHLQRADVGALAFHRFQVGDPLAGVARTLDNAIQFRRIAGADNADILQGGRGFICQSRMQQAEFIDAQADFLPNRLQRSSGLG